MSSSEEDGAISGNLDGQNYTEDQDNNNLSQALRQETVMFGINPEGITTPSGESKNASAISQIKKSPATLTSTLESCYYRGAPPSKQWAE